MPPKKEEPARGEQPKIVYRKFKPDEVWGQSTVKRFQSKREADGIVVLTPLDELREALEDDQSKEAQRFIADPMFWKHMGCIDQTRIFRTTSIEFRNLKVIFFETVGYIFFFFIFVIMLFLLQSPDVYDSRAQQHDYWLGCDGQTCKMHQVSDVASFWGWMQDSLIDEVFPPNAPAPLKVTNITTKFGGAPEYSIFSSPLMVGETNTNVLLGSVRIRQLRIMKNAAGCDVSPLFKHVYSDCYGPYGPTQAATGEEAFYGTRYTPTYILPCFSHSTAEQTQADTLSGEMSEYGPDGFFFDLPSNRPTATVMMHDLQEWNWVDRSTRAVVIEMTVLNTNTNVVVNMRLLFEFGPTGTVRPSVHQYSYRAMFLTFATGEGQELAVFIVQILVFLGFLGLIGYIGWQLSRVGVKFFTYGWNWIDVVLVLLWWLYIGHRAAVWSAVGAEPALQPGKIGDPDRFMPFSKHMRMLVPASQILAILSLLAWVKLFKYLSLISCFKEFVQVIEFCMGRLAVFATLIIVIFTGYGMAFHVALGESNEGYARADRSLTRLFFMLVSGLKVDEWWFSPWEAVCESLGDDGTFRCELSLLAPVLSLSFLVLIYFIVGNIFMAIVLEAYLCTHMDNSIGEDDLTKRNPMLLFLFAYFHQLKGISLLKENDEALPEEMGIDLDLLPGMVRNKYLEKRRRNQLIIDRYQGDLTEAELKRKTSKSNSKTSNYSSGVDGTVMQRYKQKAAKGVERAMRMLTEAINMPSQDDFNPPEPEDAGDTRFDLFGQHDDADYDQEISLNQLQRLLDQEPMLQILLGTKNALDVIRHFKRPAEEDEDDDDDPLRKVAELQETVFRKVDKLEKSGLTMDRRDVPFVKDIGDEISQSLSVVQNEWREELTMLVESITTLSDGFADLYDGIEKCSRNHTDLMDLVEGPPSTEGTQSSRSETSSDASHMAPIAKNTSKFGVSAPIVGRRSSVGIGLR
jgi:hypothetical protein